MCSDRFHAAVKETTRNIHTRLSNVYGNPAVDRSIVGRWVKRERGMEE
jgi:hypothetical protein